MLTDSEFVQWCDSNNFSHETRRLITTIRSSPPQRRVQGGGGNVTVKYSSRKMEQTIQAESHTNEMARIREFETDPETLEYWDQPPSFNLRYVARSGRLASLRHTPDYFVLRIDSAGWIECKTESKLRELAEAMPNRFTRDETGWRCPPGEEYAAQYNLFYRVLSSESINPNFQRNVDMLEAYWDESCPEVNQNTHAKVTSAVQQNPGINFNTLRERLTEVTADEFYTLIAHEQIYVDLCKVPLSQADRVHVFPDKEIAVAFTIIEATANETHNVHSIQAKVGSVLLWDERPWKISNVGASKISLTSDDDKIVNLKYTMFDTLIKQGDLVGLEQSVEDEQSKLAQEVIKRASSNDWEIANERYRIIKPFLDGEASPKNINPSKARKLRRWIAAYKQAEQIYGIGLIGLIPNTGNSGNRNPRLPKIVLELMQDEIETNYETLIQKNFNVVFGSLYNRCKELGIEPPSYKTFVNACKKRDPHTQIQKRRGHRAAYPYEAWYWELERTTPRHGERAWHIGHLDHTELDIELQHSETGKNLGKPWTSFLMDAFSRRLLVVYLSFDPPSYRTCMMVIRSCVKRYGRLPQYLVVDNGKEFSSTYFETLLAYCICHKKTRPAAKARFGNIIERLFGTANTEFVHNLKGNTQGTKDVRLTTKSTNPKEHSVWTLSELYHRMWEWADGQYNTTDHPALGESPKSAFDRSLIEHGRREHSLIVYDDLFKLMSLPTTSRGTAKVQTNSGVRVNYFDYWSTHMRDPEVEGTSVEVRFDPTDVSVVFALIKGHWVRCTSSSDQILEAKSEKLIHISSEELRKKQNLHSKGFTVRSAQIAKNIAAAESQELRLQIIKDAEAREIVNEINTTDLSSTLFPTRHTSNTAPNGQPSTNMQDAISITENENDAQSEPESRERRLLEDW